ncbi:hypothetical protein D4R78_06620 [bacterium]|nr:MAG: hypothetical protein D4R78_06620 [bacterium]
MRKGKNAFDLGFKFGHEDVDDKGRWQAIVTFERLERDAWLDIFPDSSDYSGETNIRSIQGNLIFGLAKNSSLGLNYYYSESLSEPDNPAQVLQVDWKLKF